MLSLGAGTKVYVHCQPVDMRKGFGGLAALVKDFLRHDPFSGSLYVFRGKRGDYVKLIYWDGSGMCLFAKRLEREKFVWPPVVQGSMQLHLSQLSALLEGMDWRRVIVPAELPKPVHL